METKPFAETSEIKLFHIKETGTPLQPDPSAAAPAIGSKS